MCIIILVKNQLLLSLHDKMSVFKDVNICAMQNLTNEPTGTWPYICEGDSALKQPADSGKYLMKPLSSRRVLFLLPGANWRQGIIVDSRS